MFKLLKNFLFIAVVLVALAFAFSLSSSSPKPAPVALNELAARILRGEVSSLSLSDTTVTATLAADASKVVAEKEAGVGILEVLGGYGISPEALRSVGLTVENHASRNLLLGVVLPTLLPILVVGILVWIMIQRAGSSASQAFTFGKSNLNLFTNYKDRILFKDVAGLREAKQELEEIVDFLKNPQKFLDLGARIPRGVLLMGPPGSGKTLLARAVAGEANVPFFHISASEFVEMFVGVGAARTRDAFSTAKRAAPAILFIDEIDAIGRERGSGLGGGHDEREQTLNQILVEMDGFDNETKLIILAATNRPDVLDPALLRPGRFDRRVALDLPDIAEREAILALHGKNKPLDPAIDIRRVAIRTPGFSGADLANIMNESAIIAARRGEKTIHQEDLYEAIEKVLLGPSRRGRLITDKERSLTAYHEAGHALVAASLKDSDPIHKISIVSRGRTGGFTLKLPLEEQRLKTRSQFLADLAMTLGGYAAEKIVFGDISTGASNDLRQASDIARSLVTRFGMSEKVGPIAFGKTEELIFLGREITTEKNYSEESAALIDSEVRRFIDTAHRSAVRILTSRREALKIIAETLIERETLEGDEFYALIAQVNISAPATPPSTTPESAA